MRVAYLFSNPRKQALEDIERGVQHDDHLYGLLRLRRLGFDTDYLEVEQVYPQWLVRFFRKALNIYHVHIPLFWKVFSYDIVFTPAAYGTQFLHTLLHLGKPKWVMYSFGIRGLMGEGKTLREKLIRWMTGKAAGIVTLSEGEAEMLKQRFPHLGGRIAFIPFGTDLSFFKPLDIEEENIIFFPGFAPERDYATLFAACEGMDVPVIVSCSRAVRNQATLPSFVSAREFTPQALLDMYARAKVVVLTLDISSGQNEASGCSTLVEAMAMRKAVIATDTPTMRSYITHGENGLLVPSRDSKALRDAIEQVLNDGDLRETLERNARRFAEVVCDANKTSSQLATFLRTLW